jgi:predicted NBD/HSP70 family sugar kinase
MPTKQQQKRSMDSEPPPAHPQAAVIAHGVINALGQPGNLHKVQVRSLWQDHFRVNVLVGGDALSARIAHSYFLVADGDGNIIAATPKIARQY